MKVDIAGLMPVVIEIMAKKLWLIVNINHFNIGRYENTSLKSARFCDGWTWKQDFGSRVIRPSLTPKLMGRRIGLKSNLEQK
jgi:hypothetical protein